MIQVAAHVIQCRSVAWRTCCFQRTSLLHTACHCQQKAHLSLLHQLPLKQVPDCIWTTGTTASRCGLNGKKNKKNPGWPWMIGGADSLNFLDGNKPSDQRIKKHFAIAPFFTTLPYLNPKLDRVFEMLAASREIFEDVFSGSPLLP